VGLNKCALLLKHYEVWDFTKGFSFLGRKSAAVCCIKMSGPQGELTNVLPLFLWRFPVKNKSGPREAWGVHNAVSLWQWLPTFREKVLT